MHIYLMDIYWKFKINTVLQTLSGKYVFLHSRGAELEVQVVSFSLHKLNRTYMQPSEIIQLLTQLSHVSITYKMTKLP